MPGGRGSRGRNIEVHGEHEGSFREPWLRKKGGGNGEGEGLRSLAGKGYSGTEAAEELSSVRKARGVRTSGRALQGCQKKEGQAWMRSGCVLRNSVSGWRSKERGKMGGSGRIKGNEDTLDKLAQVQKKNGCPALCGGERTEIRIRPRGRQQGHMGRVKEKCRKDVPDYRRRKRTWAFLPGLGEREYPAGSRDVEPRPRKKGVSKIRKTGREGRRGRPEDRRRPRNDEENGR